MTTQPTQNENADDLPRLKELDRILAEVSSPFYTPEQVQGVIRANTKETARVVEALVAKRQRFLSLLFGLLSGWAGFTLGLYAAGR